MNVDRNEIVRQVGVGNILAISGGRALRHEDGIILPVSNGYRVGIYLDAATDTYTVRREFRRNGTVYDKGTVHGVYADQVGEVAYRASCFRSDEFGED